MVQFEGVVQEIIEQTTFIQMSDITDNVGSVTCYLFNHQ